MLLLEAKAEEEHGDAPDRRLMISRFHVESNVASTYPNRSQLSVRMELSYVLKVSGALRSLRASGGAGGAGDA